MFKAKMVESEIFYKHRRRQTILIYTPIMLLSLGSFLLNFTPYVPLAIVLLQLISLPFVYWQTKKVESFLGKSVIEINEERIIIKSKENKTEDVIHVDKLDKLELKSEYKLPLATQEEVNKEMYGEVEEVCIIVHQNGTERKLSFVPDSFYMVKQLNKIVNTWEAKDLPIKWIR